MPRLPIAGSIVASVVFACGCAAPPIAHPEPGVLAAVDAGLLQGCYDCLLEASVASDTLGRPQPSEVLTTEVRPGHRTQLP